MSTVKSKKLQVGTDATSSNNFTIYQPATPDGTLRIGVGNADNPTEVARFDSTGMVGGGKVLQVLQAVKSDAFSTTSTSLVDVSGLSVNITPSSTSSKILVHVDLNLSASYFIGQAQLVRGTTQIYKADTAGNRPTNSITFSQNPSNDGISQRSSIMYLDSPATTSQTTYKVQASTRIDGQGGGVFYINRTTQDRDTIGYDARGVSSITVMEIAG